MGKYVKNMFFQRMSLAHDGNCFEKEMVLHIFQQKESVC